MIRSIYRSCGQTHTRAVQRRLTVVMAMKMMFLVVGVEGSMISGPGVGFWDPEGGSRSHYVPGSIQWSEKTSGRLLA